MDSRYSTVILLDTADRNLALRHTPILQLDQREPFLPSRLGVTVFRCAVESLSFPRTVMIPERAAYVIEYAIWWDWDIWHLYELEHVWVAVDQASRVVAVEGSRHGRVYRFSHWEMKGAHPLLYAQPGKHALAPDPQHFSRWRTIFACTAAAGIMGLLVKSRFAGTISSSRTIDRAIRRHLRQFAFVPSFQFNREFRFPSEAVTSWEELREYIPKRVRAVINELLGTELAKRAE